MLILGKFTGPGYHTVGNSFCLILESMNAQAQEYMTQGWLPRTPQKSITKEPKFPKPS